MNNIAIDKDNKFYSVARLLRSKHEVYFVNSAYNKGRHMLFSPPLTRDDIPKYYALFKREFFMTFNVQFEEFVVANPSFNSVGESINVDFLKTAIAARVDWLLFVYDDGKVYRVSPVVVNNFCIKHNLIRTQDKICSYKDGLSGYSVRETTYSFPISLMERFGDV